MAENDVGERSEAPTPKKKQQTREKGQVARSKELNSAAVLIAAGFAFIGSGGYSAGGIAAVLSENFILSRQTIFDTKAMMSFLSSSIEQSFTLLTPVFLVFIVVSLVAPVAIGGISFSTKAMAPKLKNISPAKGFKRMLGHNALIELVKSIAKFAVVATFAYTYLSTQFDSFMGLGHGSVKSEIINALGILSHSFLIITLSLLLIVAIDVPYQLWNHNRQIKMTKQEVKDEMKDSEGQPEVKGKIRQSQREMSYRRMMAEVPKADVVITNPEHFSVALKYNEGLVAPIVVAKGVDETAMKIREIANRHDIPIFAAPPLARAIFYATKLEHPIPEGLYLAVAQVLAYVYQLQEFRKGKATKPSTINDLDIPDNLQR